MRIAHYRAQNQAIRAAYGHIAAEPPPARLLAALDGRRKPPRWQRPLKAGAMAAALAAGGFFGRARNAPQHSGPQPADPVGEPSLAARSDRAPRAAGAQEASSLAAASQGWRRGCGTGGGALLRLVPQCTAALGPAAVRRLRRSFARAAQRLVAAPRGGG